MYYQHEGALPHFTRNVTQYQIEKFRGRCIDTGTVQNWPLLSPDLIPLEFSVWGYIKKMVYGYKR